MTTRAALLLLLVLACTRAKEAPAGIQANVALARAATCESLTQSIQDTAVRQMRARVEGSSNYGGVLSATPSAPAASDAPASYSSTNTQVRGVDEADFVKNDGTRIFTLSGQKLFAAQSWPPQDLSLQGSLAIEGGPRDMFLQGNQVVVFSNIWDSVQGAGGDILALPCPTSGCFYGSSTTKITVVDVSDLREPKVTSEIYLPGWEAGARLVGSSVRLVLGDPVRWPSGIKWYPDYDPALYQDPTAFAAAKVALADANEAILRATPLQTWFPPGERKVQGGTVELGYQCGDFYLSNAPEQLGLVTIATVDLAHLELGVSRASIVGETGTIYANADHLYLATPHWWWWAADGQQAWTYVHAFDLSDPAHPGYAGSGGVEGYVGDQFSMDEQDGYLRIATTTVHYSTDPQTETFRDTMGSALNILAPGNGKLRVVGRIPSIVEGEALMAMRFNGNKGFAVTFRSVDPLATLDLGDPANPHKVAELTVPGFSTYLQPIDADHLLSIGDDLPLNANGTADWQHRAVQLSLFDVGDLAHPLRTAHADVGSAWAYSVALWDHHAFNWYQPDPAQPGMLAIPFSDWLPSTADQDYWNSFVSDVRLFSVDARAGTIQPSGSLGMGDLYVEVAYGGWNWWYRPWVRRSVLATDVDGTQYVYAVSDAGLRSAKLLDLSHPLATVVFPPQQ